MLQLKIQMKTNLIQVGYNNVLDEPLVREDEVVAVVFEEDELAGLVEDLQADPVFCVDWRLPKMGQRCLGLIR